MITQSTPNTTSTLLTGTKHHRRGLKWTVKELTLVLVAVGCLLLSYPLLNYISDVRREHKLTAGTEALSPDQVFTMAVMAGFRGIVVDFLWIKAISLQDQHKWYELQTVTDLIVKLQPTFPTVWVFNAWNLSYNISVEWDSPADQWGWVKAGLTLLDEGLVKLPNEAQLAQEKGRIFFDKIGRNAYFRQQCEKEFGQSCFALAVKYFEIYQKLEFGRTRPQLSIAKMWARAYYAYREWAKTVLKDNRLALTTPGTMQILAPSTPAQRTKLEFALCLYRKALEEIRLAMLAWPDDEDFPKHYQETRQLINVIEGVLTSATL